MISVRDRIRWSDCDPAGIMYFGTAIRLFEIAETELLRDCGFPYSAAGMEALGAYILRVQYHTDFLAPVMLDDVVDVEILVGEIGRASFRQDFTVVRQNGSERIPAVRGTCTTVCVDMTTRKARRIPDALRSALERHHHHPEATHEKER